MTRYKGLPRFHGQREKLTVGETFAVALHEEYGRLGHILDAPRLNSDALDVLPPSLDAQMLGASATILERVIGRLCDVDAGYAAAFVLAVRDAEAGGDGRLRFRHISSALGSHARAVRRVPHVGWVNVTWRAAGSDSLDSVVVWAWIVLCDAVIGDELIDGGRGPLTYREAWLRLS